MHTIIASVLALAFPFGPTKAKLIEWGGDAPNNTAFRQQMDVLEAAPFDGTVIMVYGKDGDKPIDFTWQCWGKIAYTREQFADVVKDLKASKRKQFTDCFMRFNVTPGDVSLLDDQAWSVVLNNAKLGAWIAKEGGLKGWMLDVEQYVKPTFGYPAQNQIKPASFEEYQKATRQRGAEFMKAINSEYPGMTILFTFAHSYLATEKAKLADADYGLMPAFMDGMLEAGDKQTTFFDSLELAYPSKTREDFEKLRKLVREDGRKFSAVPDIYDKRMKIGFGLWIDLGWRTGNWDPHHPEKNHFQPKELHDALKLALELCDGYVWMYSESVSWYSRAGLTDPYIRAVAEAQTPPKKVPESKPSS